MIGNTQASDWQTIKSVTVLSMRFRILLGLTIGQFLCLAILATVLATAEILAAVGDAGAAAVFRYVALGVGCAFVTGLVILVLWMAVILIGEFLGVATATQGAEAQTSPSEAEPAEGDFEE